jgi:F420-dependent oxidoreductase-like protein
VTDHHIGILIQERDAPDAVAAIERYEGAGVPAAWMTTGGMGPDALTIFAAAAARTERILLGTCIVPILPRHPIVTVQQTTVVAQLGPGRLRLGLGPSHKPGTEAMFGIPFVAPLGHLREYVTIVKAALNTGAVDFDGKYYHAHGRMAAPLASRVPVMASALRRKAFKLCGEVADGAITWLCPVSYVRDVAVPAVASGAAGAGRPAPPIIAHAPFCLSDDPAEARAAARQAIGFYPRLPYYAQMLVDAGFPSAAQGEWTDEMVDAVVAHGNEDTVAQRLRAFLDVGAAEVIAAPIVVGDDRRAELDRAAKFLARLAR